MTRDRAFMVEVITTVRNDPSNIYDQRHINYSNPNARQWLAKHCFWAFSNGYAVHSAAAE